MDLSNPHEFIIAAAPGTNITGIYSISKSDTFSTFSGFKIPLAKSKNIIIMPYMLLGMGNGKINLTISPAKHTERIIVSCLRYFIKTSKYKPQQKLWYMVKDYATKNAVTLLYRIDLNFSVCYNAVKQNRKGIIMSDLLEVKKYSEKAYLFMLNFKAEDFADGRYDLDDEGLFVNIQTYTTNPIENQKYEAHKRYIDVQYIICGNEGFCLKDISLMQPQDVIMPYSEKDDIMFFSNKVKGDYCQLSSGEFLIMGPQCAHMPGIAVGNPSVVRKMVVKIPVK